MDNFLLNPHNRHPIARLSFCEINSSPPRASYMHQRIRSALAQIKACNLFDTKPLSKPMWDYCQLGHWEQTSVKFQSKYETFHKEIHLKILSSKWRLFCPGGGWFKLWFMFHHTVVSFAMSCYIGLHYNGIWLYIHPQQTVESSCSISICCHGWWS